MRFGNGLTNTRQGSISLTRLKSSLTTGKAFRVSEEPSSIGMRLLEIDYANCMEESGTAMEQVNPQAIRRLLSEDSQDITPASPLSPTYRSAVARELAKYFAGRPSGPARKSGV